MIHLSVDFDCTFVELFQVNDWRVFPSAWAEWCKRNSLESFSAQAMVGEPSPSLPDRLAVDATVEYLRTHLSESIDCAARVFPAVNHRINHSLVVVLLPFGKFNFGPRPGLQIFSLHADSHLTETYLFLVHVYYHEISFLNYTEFCVSCSVRQNTAEQFKYWVKLLIQNEGIANHTVLDDLLKFREAHKRYEFKYFTYARLVGMKDALAKSIAILNEIFSEVNDDNYVFLRDNVNLLLKDKRLPIINLVGIHMAQSIARRYGLDALRSVYKKRADHFFELYFQPGEPLTALFDKEAFGL